MGDITLRKAVEEYKDIYMASRNFAQKTRVEYLHDIEDLINFLEQQGIKEVKSIGLPSLERYLAELDRRGNAGSTRKRKVVSIRSFLWYLYQDQYLKVNIGKKLMIPFAEPSAPRYLTKFECNQLLLVCAHKIRDYTIVQLTLQTGIKLSELTQLTIDDLEFPSVTSEKVGYLRVAGSRTRKGRRIPLNMETCTSLADYLKTSNNTQNKALFNNRFGEPLSPRGIEKIISKYMSQAGIRNGNMQSLRHTFAVQSIASGKEIKIIQDVMGYSDSSIPSLYLSLVKKIEAKNLLL